MVIFSISILEGKHFWNVVVFYLDHLLERRRSLTCDPLRALFTDNDGCISNSTCNNTNGSFTCACDM